MEEFISLSSSTPGPTMGYDNYLTLLQNSCIRYDRNLKSRPSPASRAAYQHELSPDQHDNPYPQDYSSSGTTYGGIEFYQVQLTNLNRPPAVSTLTPRKPTSAPSHWQTHPQKVSLPHLSSCQHLQTLEGCGHQGAQKAQCHHQIHPSTQKGCQYP